MPHAAYGEHLDDMGDFPSKTETRIVISNEELGFHLIKHTLEKPGKDMLPVVSCWCYFLKI